MQSTSDINDVNGHAVNVLNLTEYKVMESAEEAGINDGNKYLNIIKEVMIHCAKPKWMANI